MTAQIADATAGPDLSREQRRRDLERRSLRAAIADALGTTWTIAAWFWGIFLVVQIVVAFLAVVSVAANQVAGRDGRKQAPAANDGRPASFDPAEVERCKVPQFARALGHEEKWKLHNNCR